MTNSISVKFKKHRPLVSPSVNQQAFYHNHVNLVKVAVGNSFTIMLYPVFEPTAARKFSLPGVFIILCFPQRN